MRPSGQWEWAPSWPGAMRGFQCLKVELKTHGSAGQGILPGDLQTWFSQGRVYPFEVTCWSVKSRMELPILKAKALRTRAHECLPKAS